MLNLVLVEIFVILDVNWFIFFWSLEWLEFVFVLLVVCVVSLFICWRMLWVLFNVFLDVWIREILFWVFLDVMFKLWIWECIFLEIVRFAVLLLVWLMWRFEDNFFMFLEAVFEFVFSWWLVLRVVILWLIFILYFFFELFFVCFCVFFVMLFWRKFFFLLVILYILDGCFYCLYENKKIFIFFVRIN